MSTSLLLWLLSTLFFLVAFCFLGKIRKLNQLDNACQNDDSLVIFRPIWKGISGEKWKRLTTRKFITGCYGLSGLISTPVNDDSTMLRRKGFEIFFLHIRSLLFPLPKSYRLIKHEPTMFFNSQISNRSIFSAQKPLSHRLLKNCLSLIDCNFIDRYRQGQRYRYQSKV